MAIDQTTLSRINQLHPALITEVKDLYLNKIVPALTGDMYCRFAYTMRSFDEQNALYAQGRTKLFDQQGKRLGIVTDAKGGQSFHNYGLAIDIVLIDGSSASWNTAKDYDMDGKADWMEVINIFIANGWTWGGNFSHPDAPHIQKTFGYTWDKLFDKYNQKDFIPGTYFVNL